MTQKLSPGRHIAHVHLRVRNLESELYFYRQLLGFIEVELDSAAQTAGSTVALSSSGHLSPQIVLTEAPQAPARPSRSTGLFHAAIRFPSRAELAKAVVRLAQNGYPIHGASDHLVSEAIYLADPEGNGIELYWDRPNTEWKRNNGEIAMATEMLDVDDLLREAEGTTWTGIHPRTDIGHIHLNVSSLSGAEEFYSKKLGFDVTTRSYPGALFLAAGGYHHHIGANVWSSRNAPPPPENSAGLLSFGISVPEREWEILSRNFAAGDGKNQNLVSQKVLRLHDYDAIGVEIISPRES